MKLQTFAGMLFSAAVLVSCAKKDADAEKKNSNAEFEVEVEQFADIKVLRYQIPGWEAGCDFV